MSDAKDRTLEDLRGSFLYAWLVLGSVDVVVGVLGTFHFMEGADLNQGSAQLALLGIVLATSVVAFFCGSQFRADKNREKLVDNAQALVNTYKAAANKVERDCAGKVQQSEHRIGELTTQLEAEKTRAASVNELERKYTRAQERVAELQAALEADGAQAEDSDADSDYEERKRKAVRYARNLALGLSYEDKDFLLALGKHGCIQFEDVSRWNVSSDLHGVRELVEQTEIAFNVHRVWLNERGQFVIQEARDILEMLVPNDVGEDLWWSYGTFVEDVHEGLMSGGDE